MFADPDKSHGITWLSYKIEIQVKNRDEGFADAGSSVILKKECKGEISQNRIFLFCALYVEFAAFFRHR